MSPSSKRPTRGELERAARELTGMNLSPRELETLLRRLDSVREALAALEDLADGEPLLEFSLEGEDET